MVKGIGNTGVSRQIVRTLVLTGTISVVTVTLAHVVGAGSADAALPGQETAEHALTVDCDPALSARCVRLRHAEGRKLFDEDTFGGNGRTCRT